LLCGIGGVVCTYLIILHQFRWICFLHWQIIDNKMFWNELEIYLSVICESTPSFLWQSSVKLYDALKLLMEVFILFVWHTLLCLYRCYWHILINGSILSQMCILKDALKFNTTIFWNVL
jgi:hypothetical protein